MRSDEVARVSFQIGDRAVFKSSAGPEFDWLGVVESTEDTHGFDCWMRPLESIPGTPIMAGTRITVNFNELRAVSSPETP
jgi:hypothetical protein